MFRSLLCGGYEDYLRRAAAKGDEKRLKKLLKRGVVPDPKEPGLTSALQLAVQNGHTACVKALLEAGSDVNRVSDSTPLIDAASHGQVEVLKLLLENKADPNTAVDGNTAFHMAARFGHQSVIDVLAPLVDVAKVLTAANAQGKTPLMLACSQRDGGEAVVKYLLGAGAAGDAVDQGGNTALHLAALVGNASLAKLLVVHDKKAMAIVNHQGRIPLHLAAAFGSSEVVDVILQQKQSDVACKDKEGSTVLHMVAKCVMCDKASQLSMAKALIKAGVDPTAEDGAGHTAAHYASLEELKEVLSGSAETAPAAIPAHVKPAAEDAVLATSSSGASGSTSGAVAQAACKAEKLSMSLAGALAGANGAEPAEENSWVIKQALRTRTSEEPDGWKLTTAVDDDHH